MYLHYKYVRLTELIHHRLGIEITYNEIAFIYLVPSLLYTLVVPETITR
jgi:hypothetical protein